MTLCPKCQHKELVGALFCSECGTQLIYAEEEAPLEPVVSPPTPQTNDATDSPDAPDHPPASSETRVSLRIIETGEIIPVVKSGEVTLGRVSEGQPIVPDVDLTPYQAYEAGVSRLHASLKIFEGYVFIVDLGSANGTLVNGKKISPNNPQPIQDGDILTFGKFKIEVQIRS